MKSAGVYLSSGEETKRRESAARLRSASVSCSAVCARLRRRSAGNALCLQRAHQVALALLLAWPCGASIVPKVTPPALRQPQLRRDSGKKPRPCLPRRPLTLRIREAKRRSLMRTSSGLQGQTWALRVVQTSGPGHWLLLLLVEGTVTRTALARNWIGCSSGRHCAQETQAARPSCRTRRPWPPCCPACAAAARTRTAAVTKSLSSSDAESWADADLPRWAHVLGISVRSRFYATCGL
mmetsp:Transcript_24515/g.70422  ORF Transcript_24515/g.70422 Transcript_24515/m.70422 type:complete len:238 (+) Transcript_24515:1706-2419(+)